MPDTHKSVKQDHPLLEKLRSDELTGPEFCRANAEAMDETLRELAANLFKNAPDLALFALGGYGRRELCPYSDIDLMFFTQGTADKKTNEAIEKFLYALWDRGLKVGHSTRNMEDCLALSRKDSKIMTSLLDSRQLFGPAEYNSLLRKEISLLL